MPDGYREESTEFPSWLPEKVKAWIQSQKSQTQKINWYVCESKRCGHVALHISVHRGVTPFVVKCTRCDSMAQSTLSKPPFPEAEYKVTEMEWYRPGDREFRKLSDAMKEHSLQGGLSCRAAADG
jgi:hypothetical protein